MRKKLLFTLFTILGAISSSLFAQVGFTCDNPIQIASLPYQTTDNTANYGDTTDVSQPTSCGVLSGNYMTGNDVFYSYTAPTTGLINIKMAPQASYSGIFVYNSCANVGVSCLAGVGNSGLTIREIPALAVVAGQTYIFVISTYATPQTVAYTFNIQSINCAPPSQLTVSNLTQTMANASWLNLSNATSWEVATQLSTITTTPSSGILTTSNSNYPLTGLVMGTAYKVYVRASCGGETYSPWTVPASFTTPLCASPSSLAASAITQTSANISWANPENATSWQIATQLSTITTTPTTGSLTTSNTNYPITGLTPGATYKAYVRADCGNGIYSAWSAVFSFSTLQPELITPTCGGTFTDAGGLTLNYYNNSNSTVTVYPTNPGEVVTVNFTAFDTETNYDGLYVFNGNSTTAPQFSSGNPAASVPGGQAGSYWGTAIPGPFTSTSSDGSLTFKFISDSTLNKTGWSANVSCGPAPTCPAPMSLAAATNITFSGATVNWTEIGTATQWEVLVLPATALSPTASSTGILVTSSPYQITGLTNATVYKVFVRAICSSTDFSTWTTIAAFTTTTCTIPYGLSATNISANSSNLSWASGGATQWEVVLQLAGNPAPSETTSGIAVNTNSFAATNLACVSTYNVYIRSICSSALNSAWSSVYSFTTLVNQAMLSNMNQCDDDGNGTVLFDLTSVQSQINANTSLQYYSSLTNATAQTSPITNPSNYAIASTSASITIYVRVASANACDAIYSFQLHAYSDCNLAHVCNQANSLCGSLGIPYTNTHQNISAETGNNYGCLYSTPNPTWFYLPVSHPGTINLTVQQNDLINFTGTGRDVDYIVYGPFANPVAACNIGFTTANTVSCSYSAAAIEHPIIPNAQIGQYYLLMVTNFSNQPGFIKIDIDPTSSGAIDCSGLRLNAFLDTNNNGAHDTNEVNFPLGQFQYEKNADGNIHNISSPTGIYNIYETNASNSYQLSYAVDPAYTAMYSLTTTSYSNAAITIGGGMTTYNFPVTTTQNYTDLSVVLVPENAPRAGGNYNNKMVYANLGNQTISSGTVTFSNDLNTTINTISQSGTTPVANGFSYTFSNLLPFETRTITVNLHVPPIPAVAIGQLLTNTVAVIPPTGDIVLSNNSASITQTIIASYDPNDKTESHGENIVYSSFAAEEYLFYTIRFENTGSASAIDVLVSDLLDAKIDETSVKVVSASHDYTLDRVANALTWRFKNIQLPVSVADTDTGKGYIMFKAKLKPGFEVGDSIPNTANIFFDSNPAIITNTFTTNFVAFLGTTAFNSNNIRLFPNPANNRIQISMSNTAETIDRITLFNYLGESVKRTTNIASNQASIDITALAKGVYLVEIVTESDLKLVKKLIVN